MTKNIPPLESCGFQDPLKASYLLHLMAGPPSVADLFQEITPLFLEALKDSPDPDLALTNFKRFSEAVFNRATFYRLLHDDPSLINRLVLIFGWSQYLADTLIHEPEYLEFLMTESIKKKARLRASMLAELQANIEIFETQAAKINALRRFKRRQLLRIGIRDILGVASLPEIAKELTVLAEVALEVALRISWHQLEKTHGVLQEEGAFTVIALGKLGGGELNYSSDIDVIFVYEGQGDTDGQRSLSAYEFFTRIGEGIIKALSVPTELGQVYRVDTNLRPEGRDGPLVRSFESYGEYYRRWAETWEFQALLKARPVAGSHELGKKVLRLIEPKVYRKHLEPQSLEDIKSLKRRSEAHIRKRGLSHWEVKLGVGGIRDIEFTVQLLQLLYGHRHRGLRTPNNLKALRGLERLGFINETEARLLADGYIFLRKIEHYLQIMQQLQLHSLPKDPAKRAKVARRLGYRDGKVDALTQFDAHFRTTTGAVREIFERIFKADYYRPDERPSLASVLYNPYFSTDVRLDYFQSMGFENQERAYRELLELASFPESQKFFVRLGDTLLGEMAETADRDLSLHNFHRFLLAVGARANFYRLLLDNVWARRGLIALFGTSSALSETLTKNPEFMDLLADRTVLEKAKPKDELDSDIGRKVASLKTYRAQVNTLRRFKRRELLRIGMRDILGMAPLPEITGELTVLAETALKIALRISWEKLEGAYGKPKGEAAFAVIALGKLGGGELNYSSDIDVIFVYKGQGDTEGPRSLSAHEFFTRLGEGLIKVLSAPTEHGQVFRVDTNLRPEGRGGPLVRSLGSYDEYYQRWAETWEFQALIKARPVAGSKGLGQKFLKLIGPRVFRKQLEPTAVEEIKKMKRRIEEERAGAQAKFNVKLGPGTLIDIEFATQYLQLRNGAQSAKIRKPNTLEGLDALKNANFLDPESHRILSQGYLFLRRIENRLQIEKGLSESVLPEKLDDLVKLSRRLGYADDERGKAGVEQFLADYERVTNEIKTTTGVILEGSN